MDTSVKINKILALNVFPIFFNDSTTPFMGNTICQQKLIYNKISLFVFVLWNMIILKWVNMVGTFIFLMIEDEKLLKQYIIIAITITKV